MGVRLSLGIAVLSMWLVPQLGIKMAGFRISIDESEFWTGRRLEQGRRAVNLVSAVAICSAVLIYAGTAIGVALSTQNMDPRADAIVIGFGNLLAAVALTMLSYKMGKWLGVYHSKKKKNVSGFGEDADILTLRRLKFEVCWALWKYFAQIYFLISLQYCAAQPETIPVSALIGIVCGLVVYYGVYVGRTKWKARKAWVAAALASGLSIAASAAWAYGVHYVQVVWSQNTGMSSAGVLASMFFSWLAVCTILNLCIWWYTKRKMEQSQKQGRHLSTNYGTEMFAPAKKSGRDENGDNDDNEDEPTVSSLAVGQVFIASKDGRNGEALGDDENGQEVHVRLDDDEKKDSENGVADKECGAAGPVAMTDRGDDGSSSEIEKAEELSEEERARIVREAEESETTCGMVLAKCRCCDRCCCCCRSGEVEEAGAEERDEKKQKNCGEKVLSGCKWFWTIIVNVLCLYTTVVNIGATQEMEVVRIHLPNATRNLYPPDYQNGTMCAWNEPTPNGTLRTFDTLEAVYEANWTVAHCEACSNCSNWNDMEIQWITRDNLAAMAQKCALKSVFGSAKDVQKCYMEEVGFLEGCAGCWTFDSLCSKNYCTFIFLQAIIINNAGNFSVGPQHVTSATCEEAMCGEHYAPCAGATRRRMNIESDIERPEFQQCSVAEHDWAAVFNHP